MSDEGPSKKSKADEPEAEAPNGTRGAPDDIVPPSVANVNRGKLLDEAGVLQGALLRCRTCNSVMSHDAIVCSVCNRPTQRDLTDEDAAFVQAVANEAPQQFHEALERVRPERPQRPPRSTLSLVFLSLLLCLPQGMRLRLTSLVFVWR